MALGIKITFTHDRAEQINGRLLALQVEIGGCMIYVGDNVIRWEPEALLADNFDSITEALDKMVEFEAIDPMVDDFVIEGEDGKLAEWNEGFTQGFRNNSIPALQSALTWARSVDTATLQAKIDEYVERAKGMGERDIHMILPILGDLRLVLAERQTSCVAP